MFKRILIANRGEIACRIIKTARRMGIETVAVYSEADKDALHVEMADTAVAIGPPEAAKSYLLIDRIVEACKASGAQAVGHEQDEIVRGLRVGGADLEGEGSAGRHEQGIRPERHGSSPCFLCCDVHARYPLAKTVL